MSRKALARIVVPFVLKAAADPESRTFEGLAATWDEDLGQDIIHKGAFKNTLAKWKGSSDAMPLLNSHDHFDIFSAIGQMIDGKETKDGLNTKWEVIDGPDGDRVMQRLRPSKTTGRPVIGKMSIGFVPTKFSFEQPEGTDSFFDRKRHIEEADLKEVSLVLFPMNPGAAIDASSVKMFMKSLELTDPREVSKLDRMQLRKLASRIGVLLKKEDKSSGADIEATQDSTTDDTDESDELDEQDPSSSDSTSTDTESDEEETDTTSETDDSTSTSDTSTETDTKGVYQMGEALSQRLQRTILSARTSTLREQSR